MEQTDENCQQGSTARFVDACCQTDFVKINEDLPQLKKHMFSNGLEALTAESITETAQTALNRSGWVYDKSTGTYFDYNTNLYYYPNTRLYYNYKNGCYYKYNQETNRYDFHYQLESFKKNFYDTRSQKDISTPIDRILKLSNLKQIKFFNANLPSKALEITKTNEDPVKNASTNQVTSQRSKVNCNRHQRKICLQEKHVDGVLSDSETGYEHRPSRRFFLCRHCCSYVTNQCRSFHCKKEHELGKKDGLNTCIQEDSSFSDSELEMLTMITRKYVSCKECKQISSTSCCVKSVPWTNKTRKRRKSSSETDKDVMKRTCIDTGQTRYAHTGDHATLQAAVMKERLQYNLDQDQSNFAVDLESELNTIPCVRMMTTTSDSIKEGTLFLITCTGASIGSSEHCDIQIQEDKVEEEHASIFYNQQQRNYFVTDLGSEFGTTLNSTTEHNPGTRTVIATPVGHKSVLLIGNSVFVLHLHIGYETCDDCEPGQIQALLPMSPSNSIQILSKEEKEAMRRSELKGIKKRYGLHKEEYKQQSITTIVPGYVDRAAERRLTKGSDNPYEKDEMPTSFETELADHNKGCQMLKKMGWSSGQSLGKSQTGITEPIVPQGSGKGKHGLGFGNIQRS